MIVSDIGLRRATGVGGGVSSTTTASGTAPNESSVDIRNGSPGT